MTRILVLGIDGASPDLLLGDERLTNLRGVMAGGIFGSLETVLPCSRVPSWASFATGHTPAELGIVAPRVRNDRSYASAKSLTEKGIRQPTIWGQVEKSGKRPRLRGVPPWEAASGPGSADAPGDLTPEEIQIRTHENFIWVETHLAEDSWDYLHLVDTGLDLLHASTLSGDRAGLEAALQNHCRQFDERLGRILGQLDEDTVLLIVSTHKAATCQGRFCLNEWLVHEGFLALHSMPDEPTPLNRAEVDWARTIAWADGGPVGQIFLNVKGREPEGVVEPADIDRVRADLTARLGRFNQSKTFDAPIQILRPDDQPGHGATAILPELLLHLGDSGWNVDWSLGHGSFDIVGDVGCKRAVVPGGLFVLAGPGVPMAGELIGTNLLDLAPTLLELGGLEFPPALLGRPTLTRFESAVCSESGYSEEDDLLVQDRLAGLGYI